MKNITIVGRLGKDPETKSTQNGTDITTFSVAVNRIGKDKDGEKKKPIWFKVIAFSKTGEIAQQYLSKGSEAAISGDLELEEWTNRNGEKVVDLKVVANSLSLIGGKKETRESGDDSFDAGNFD